MEETIKRSRHSHGEGNRRKMRERERVRKRKEEEKEIQGKSEGGLAWLANWVQAMAMVAIEGGSKMEKKVVEIKDPDFDKN